MSEELRDALQLVCTEVGGFLAELPNTAQQDKALRALFALRDQLEIERQSQ